LSNGIPRKLAVQASMKALSVGLPGGLKSGVTPRMKAHKSNALLMNSGPLSNRIIFGHPICRVTRSSGATTRYRENAVAPRSLATRRLRLSRPRIFEQPPTGKDFEASSMRHRADYPLDPTPVVPIVRDFLLSKWIKS
jgi:hypothetical protein